MTTVFNLNRYDKIVANDLSLNGTISTALGGLSQWEDSGSDIYFSGGNVGIGTTSPGTKLHIHSSGTNYLRLTSGSLSNGLDFATTTGGDAFIVQNENANLRISTNATERMRIDSNGNVGIGTTSPGAILDVNGSMRAAYNANTASYFGRAAIGYVGHTDWAGFAHLDHNNTSSYALMQAYTGQTRLNSVNGEPLYFLINNSVKMTLASSGLVGIGTAAPATHLHIYSSTTGAGPSIRLDNAASSPWDLYINGYSTTSSYDRAFYFTYNSALKGRISQHANKQMNTFTGQHICNVDNIKYTDLDNYIGLIVSANKNDFVSVNKNEIQRGIEGISITESVPIVSLTQKTKDKSCFGVIAYKENENNREMASGVFITSIEKQLGDNRIHINSLGEGAIWVSNKNGTLESGDYITTSDIPGYGEKQDDDLLHNYTVAKITMDCNFLLEKQNRMVIKREDVQFYTDASNNTYDLSNNLIHYGAYNPDLNKQSENTVQYFNKTFDNSGNVLSVTRNVLNENGEIQWEQTNEQEQKYLYRYIDASGSILTKDQYDTMMSGGQNAYIAAFVGCTYHCG